MLDFQDFLFQKVPLVGTLSKTRVLISRTYVAKQKVPLVTTLSKTRVLISRTYVAKQGMNLPILSETLKICWSHSIFAWEKYL